MYIKTKVKKTSLWQSFYSFFICLNVLAKVLVSSNVTNVLGLTPSNFEYYILRGTIIGFLILFVLEKKHSKMKITILAIMVICVAYTYINAGTLSFTLFFLLIAAYPKGTCSRNVAKHIYKTLALSILTVVVLCMLGLIRNIEVQRINNIDMRNSMGFSSANALANTVLYCLLAFVAYKENQWNGRDSLIWAAVIGCTYFVTNGRMSCAISFAVVIIETIWAVRNYMAGNVVSVSKAIFHIERIIFVLALTVCYFLTRFYAEGKYYQQLSMLDFMATYRLSFMVKYYRDPGISLFGQLIKTVTASQAMATGAQWSGLDNSYLYMLIVWGIIGTVIYSILTVYLGKYHENEQNKYGALCVIAICLISVSEASLFNVSSNLMLIMFAEMINNYSLREEGVNQ